MLNPDFTGVILNSALAGPRNRLGHPDTAYHKSASHSLKHGLVDALKYILEWAAAVCTTVPHFSIQFVQSFADAIEYYWEWAAAVCNAAPHLSVQFVQSLDHFSVLSMMPKRDCFDQLTLLYLNKDHQRMKVDPMFMIIQSLGSFLTAVTPTTVAPIAAIWPKFDLIWTDMT